MNGSPNNTKSSFGFCRPTNIIKYFQTQLNYGDDSDKDDDFDGADVWCQSINQSNNKRFGISKIEFDWLFSPYILLYSSTAT